MSADNDTIVSMYSEAIQEGVAKWSAAKNVKPIYEYVLRALEEHGLIPKSKGGKQ